MYCCCSDGEHHIFWTAMCSRYILDGMTSTCGLEILLLWSKSMLCNAMHLWSVWSVLVVSRTSNLVCNVISLKWHNLKRSCRCWHYLKRNRRHRRCLHTAFTHFILPLMVLTTSNLRTKMSPDYQTKHDKAKINIQINRTKEATQTAKNGRLWKTRW